MIKPNSEFYTTASGGTGRIHKNRKVERVAIIGAGVAGCAMAAALKDQRIDFVVYDNNSKAGGLWADNYPGAKGKNAIVDFVWLLYFVQDIVPIVH